MILLSPAGRRLDQALARELSAEPWLVLICGRYEGVDERVVEGLPAEEVSIGDYVLSGGEVGRAGGGGGGLRGSSPAWSATRSRSPAESFEAEGLLDHPHYTRPREYRGMEVPEVLLSGDHAAIAAWRRDAAAWRRPAGTVPICRPAARRSPAPGREASAAAGCSTLGAIIRSRANLPQLPGPLSHEQIDLVEKPRLRDDLPDFRAGRHGARPRARGRGRPGAHPGVPGRRHPAPRTAGCARPSRSARSRSASASSAPSRCTRRPSRRSRSSPGAACAARSCTTCASAAESAPGSGSCREPVPAAAAAGAATETDAEPERAGLAGMAIRVGRPEDVPGRRPRPNPLARCSVPSTRRPDR